MTMDVKKFIGWCIKGIIIKIRKMTREQKRLVMVAMLALLVGGMFGNFVGRSKEEKKSEKKVAQAVAEVQEEEQIKFRKIEKQLYDLKEEL